MKIINNAKSIISTDLIEIVASILISVLLEISRVLLSSRLFGTGKIKLEDLSNAFNIEVWDSINTIILLTLIIWGVTGLAKMMEKSNHGKKKKSHTLFMLLVFILCTIWYVAKIFFVVDMTMIVVTSIFSTILLILLTSYFTENKKINIYKSDNRIA